MSRPKFRMLVAVLVVVGVVFLGRREPMAVPIMAVVAIATSLGSVVLGRDFFRGRAAMAAGNNAEAIEHFDRFVASASSGRVRALEFLWLGIYTSDPIALALNNIGACRLNMRSLDEAAAPLEEALRRDPRYAVPHVNLAIVQRLHGNEAGAKEHEATAVRLGYDEDALDALVRRTIAAHNEALGRRL